MTADITGAASHQYRGLRHPGWLAKRFCLGYPLQRTMTAKNIGEAGDATDFWCRPGGRCAVPGWNRERPVERRNDDLQQGPFQGSEPGPRRTADAHRPAVHRKE